MWLNALKIAIVQKDVGAISTLLDDIPQLKKQEDIDSAICLLQEANTLMVSLQQQTKDSMTQMKKNINFLKSTQEKQSSTLDIKS